MTTELMSLWRLETNEQRKDFLLKQRGFSYYRLKMTGIGNHWTVSWLKTICVTCLISRHRSNPAVEGHYGDCERLVYGSDGRHQGTFYSPLFPQVYPPRRDCVLYTFIGDKTEIVELTILEFDLRVPTYNRCRDYLRLYLDLEHQEQVFSLPWNYELCGNISAIPKQHYSSTNVLMMKFHSELTPQNHTGFRGIYKFLDKAQFSFEGETFRSDSKCSYDFYSNRNAFKTGRFFSPRYPQQYPPNSACQYFFHGQRDERVKVTFQNIQLEIFEGSCSSNPDRIIVRDGLFQSSRIIAQYCNTLNAETVWSSGENLFVELETDGQKQRQGFAAVFSFIFESQPQTEPIVPPIYQPHQLDFAVIQNPGDSPVDHVSSPDDQLLPSTTTMYNKRTASHCEHIFLSQQRRSGTFSSPQFGAPYPADLICKYIFRGEKGERVQIIFSDLSFSQSSGDVAHCGEGDSVTVTTFIDQKASDIGVYCDSKRPTMLMSSDNNLEVTFVSKTNNVKGFKAKYNFVTDFGIKAGEPLLDTPCGFFFRSENTSNGTFTSPNFPGFYPRNTECHYLFYGRNNEKIHITFPYFEVEGIYPGCSDETESDYVEFSNFNIDLHDRKMSRLCGTKDDGNRRRTVSSDGSFFRVTFKSNHVWDATGFEAFYQFRKVEGIPDRRVKPFTTSSSAKQRSTGGIRLSLCSIDLVFAGESIEYSGALSFVITAAAAILLIKQ